MAAEISLKDAAIAGAIKHGAPLFQLADALGRLLGVNLRHSPLVEILASFHRIAKMRFPIVAGVDVGQRRGDASLGHHGVRFSQQ